MPQSRGMRVFGSKRLIAYLITRAWISALLLYRQNNLLPSSQSRINDRDRLSMATSTQDRRGRRARLTMPEAADAGILAVPGTVIMLGPPYRPDVSFSDISYRSRTPLRGEMVHLMHGDGKNAGMASPHLNPSGPGARPCFLRQLRPSAVESVHPGRDAGE